MKKEKRYFAIILVAFLLLLPFSGLASASSVGNDVPSLEATVSPTGATEDEPLQVDINKPVNGPALGNLEFNVTAKGVLDESTGVRKPIEVVFVMDTSGSMKDRVPGKMKVEKRVCVGRFLFICSKYEKKIVEVNEVTKLYAAKTALNNAIDEVFSQNFVDGDKYALVSFSDNIIVTTNLTNDVNSIKTNVENLSAEGGTNYTQALGKANEILGASTTGSKKYIIFLTDGEPTVAKVYEGNDVYKYTIYTNNNADLRKYYGNYWYLVKWLKKSEAETGIKNSISSAISKIKANDISLYSIGFVTSEVESNYLLSISDKTEKGNSENLSALFNEFANEITQYGIKDAKIKVKLPKVPGNVVVQAGADVKVEGDYAIVNIATSIPYLPGEPTPVLSNSELNLPIQFSQKGDYIFDDIKLEYNNIEGIQEVVDLATSTNPVKISVVEDDASPRLTGTGTFNQDVSKLEKEGTENRQSNQFDVNYEVVPSGGMGTGIISEIEIKQQLPEGITAVSAGSNNFVVETDKNGKNNVIISLNNINYQDGSNNVILTRDFPSISKNHKGKDQNTSFNFTFDETTISGTIVVPGNNTKWHVHFNNDISANEGYYIVLENNPAGVLVTSKNMNNLGGKPIKLIKKAIGGPTTFSPAKLTATLKLQADYAVQTELPETIVQYNVNESDRIARMKVNGTIKNVVTLKSGSKFSPIVGDHDGQIEVTDKATNNKTVKFGVKSDDEMHKAVKTMEFALNTNERYIKVKYMDDSYGLVNLYDVGISFNNSSYEAKIGETIQNAIGITTWPSGFQPSDIIVEPDKSIVEISPMGGQTLQRNIKGLKQGMTKITAKLSYNDYDIDDTGNLLEQINSKTVTALVKVSGEVTKPGGTNKDW